jgi:hypothetical protein
VALVAVLLATPAAAETIVNGIDVWQTPGDGRTFVDFATEPIPGGFFCAGSAAFTGRIPFRGVPVATEPAGVLGVADTVVRRLDDASFVRGGFAQAEIRGADGAVREHGPGFFNRRGEVATTRIQVQALSFEGLSPVRTSCGRFRVRASLAGEQPVTDMVIVRERDGGGHFFAPLALNVKLTFTPVRGGGPVELTRAVHFPAKLDTEWAADPEGGVVRYEGSVRVDTDADGVADRELPGTSNFAAGVRSAGGGRGPVVGAASTPYCSGPLPWPPKCHAVVPVEPIDPVEPVPY